MIAEGGIRDPDLWQSVLLYLILQALACFEGRNFGSGDLHGFARPGIPAGARAAGAGFKGAESGQDDLSVFHDAADDGVQRCGNDLLGFRFGDFCFGGYDFNQFSFIHAKKLPFRAFRPYSFVVILIIE